MESYLLKSSLSLIVLYAVYRIMVQYEFNHQLNRFIGLTCILFSVSFPFVQFGDLSQVTRFPGTYYVMAKGTVDLRETVTSVISDKTISVVLVLYAIGVGVFFVRSAVGWINLLMLYQNSSKFKRWDFKVAMINGEMSPFVFFNVLFIGSSRVDDSEMETIVMHERVHRDQYHSVDALVLELLNIVYWFNPVMWFFIRDIKSEHEYFADEQVLEKGIDPLRYQLMLFKARTGSPIELGNHFNRKTGLIKRFHMMTKARSKPKGRYLRVSVFLTLMFVILFLGAFSDRKRNAQVDKPATYEQGEEAMYKSITSRISYPVSARRENRSGVVRVSFIVDENGNVQNVKEDTGGTGYLLNEIVVVGYSTSQQETKGINDAIKVSSVSAVEGLGKFTPARKDGKSVNTVLILPVRFVLMLK